MSRFALLTDGGEPAVEVAAAPVGRWSAAGRLPLGMRWFGQMETPQLLHDGRVLMAGGTGAGYVARSEATLYDPVANAWAGTGGLGTARRTHTLTVLDDGQVLAVGGSTGPASYPNTGLASAELYNPDTETWTPTGALAQPRQGHSASLLLDGRVLVAGGNTVRSPRTDLSLTSAEVYDPVARTWTTTTTPMVDPRWNHHAVVLLDGRVLVTGGLISNGYGMTAPLALCELYDPATDTWSAAATMSTPRCTHQTVRLLDGSVLAIGGGATRLSDDATNDPYSVASCERYDPASDQWRADTGMPWGRSYHRAVLLPSGDCLVVAGTDDASLDAGFQNAVRYDPATRMWTPTAGMITGRWSFGATALKDGRVLAAGGVSRTGIGVLYVADDLFALDAEVYTP